ncbi:hypothetical protein LTR37_009927 [Vermiconidia calcicola]|uniref:Uncharacterized protein n=1 Tax=Vermiconidia calcicola TaxID=1690605 RepID=A0ACC3N648_9PEZI|nr:hypothetical protein LTR37_009927 [Vermiconidia calcicola]
MELSNGIDHEQRRPLKVQIAGGGIGGLCAAIGLRQQGHHVSVYEQSALAHEAGAAIHIAPNCNGLLQRLGLDPRQHGSVEFEGMTEYTPSGEVLKSMDLRAINHKMWQHSWELIHRAHLHSALKELAISPKGIGKPVELHLSNRVDEVDPSKASIHLSDGTEVEGDLVIGADGVHSKIRKAIPGGEKVPFDCGKSAFRFLLPTQSIAADEKTAPFLQNHNHLVMWIGTDRRLVMYPCVGGTQMNFVAIHPSEESAVDGGGDAWQQSASKGKMMKIYESFGESVAALLNKVDEPKIWTLLDMDQMPHFVHGSLAILGDAAHPFLPHQAQGGAQAIEDAVSLAALFPLGTAADEVPERLQLYEGQRYERSHKIQEYTRLAGRDLAKGQSLDMQSFIAYNVGHDEWHASTAALQKHLAAKRPDTRWRTPIGFGPAPGPRQPLSLSLENPELAKIRKQTPETSSALIIRFKSSRTYLQNLLPPGFAFVSPATVCEATLLCNTLDGMTWLGGGGYSFIMLQIHGIKYTKKNGDVIFGSFIPLLFEDLTDPIVTGRDDLGMPKLYAAISVTHIGDKATVEISWRGTKIGSMEFAGLSDKEQEPGLLNGNDRQESASQGPPPPPDNGHLAWRFVPAVGRPGQADAEYPVFVPKPDPGKFFKDAQVSTAAEASFEFSAGDWNSLPTLHNVTRVLAEMPKYDVLEAKHVRSHGVDDLSSAYRIE